MITENEVREKIKELEEQEKFNFDYRAMCRLEEYQRWADNEITKLNKKNKQLKQQLEEKEKDIEKLNACVDFYKSYYLSFNEKVIDELEKVKEFVNRQLFITTKDCNDLDEAEAKGCNELRKETIKEIDNQIKQLKGEKE